MSEVRNKAFHESGKIYVIFDGGLFATGYALPAEDQNNLEWIGDFDSGMPIDVPERVQVALRNQLAEIGAEKRAADKLACDALRRLTHEEKEAIRERIEVKFEREWF